MKIRVPEKITLEQGLYPARLESIEEMSNDRGNYLRWTFAVNYEGETIRRVANSSTSFGARSKACGWLQAVIGRTLEAGEELDIDALLPLDCRIMVKTTDDGFDRIEDVMGVKSRQQVSGWRRAAAQEPDIEDDDLPF